MVYIAYMYWKLQICTIDNIHFVFWQDVEVGPLSPIKIKQEKSQTYIAWLTARADPGFF